METPGFDLDKMGSMDKKEKSELSDSELRSQVGREQYQGKIVREVNPNFMDGTDPVVVTEKIRDDALEENQDRANLEEGVIQAKYQNSESKKDYDALAAAQKKVEDAWNLIEDSKRQ